MIQISINKQKEHWDHHYILRIWIRWMSTKKVQKKSKQCWRREKKVLEIKNWRLFQRITPLMALRKNMSPKRIDTRLKAWAKGEDLEKNPIPLEVRKTQAVRKKAWKTRAALRIRIALTKRVFMRKSKPYKNKDTES